ncbi:MAG: hypothetical protein ABI193_08570 [Minicystis sp.]
MRLDDLEEVVRQVREAAEVIAEDLGIPEEKRTPVELVDLLGGSCGLALEQVIPDFASQAPLAVLTDAASERAHGRPIPKYLTDRAARAVDDTVITFGRLASRGRPVRVRSFEDVDSSLVLTISAQPRPPYSPSGADVAAPPLRVIEVEFPPVAPPAEPGVARSIEPLAGTEPGRWLVELSGKVERLDDGAKRLTLRTDRKLVGPLQLDDEQFHAVDAEDARWKVVRVRGLSSAPELRVDAEIIDVAPHSGEPISSAVPATTSAAALQPVLDKLRSFRELVDGWDSYGGLAPRAGAVGDAEKFTLSLAMRGTAAAPFAAPVPTGSVQLEWESGEAYLELEFFGSGRIKGFRIHGDTEIVLDPVDRVRALELVEWFGGMT